jgi:TerC family integral membrane protein
MGTAVPTWTWVAFAAGITVLLVLDLRVLHRHPHALGVREAALQSAGWITLGLAFGVVVLAWRGSTLGGEYFSAYLIEESLSIDNVFAWALILAHFAVPPAFQHRVLFWGILGAIVLRVVFILGGVSLLECFDWIVYVFGAFLLVTAARLVFRDDSKLDPNRHPIGRLVHAWKPPISELSAPSFVLRRGGRAVLTPLFAVLLLVATTDVIFAVDSIPAVLGVTQDRFVAVTSNVFAVLGLRALFFLLAALQARFSYLQQGMAVILGLVGTKMLLSGVVEIPVGLSIAAILIVLGVSVLSSLRVHPGEEVWPDGRVP